MSKQKSLSERFKDRHNLNQNRLTPIEQLDLVLEFIDICYTTETIWTDAINIMDALSVLAEEGMEIGSLDFGIIVNKLVKDQYIEHRDLSVLFPDIYIENKDQYRISFDGKLFLQQGGYCKEKELIDAKLRQDARTDNVLRFAGWATIAWFVLELAKFLIDNDCLFDYCHCPK